MFKLKLDVPLQNPQRSPAEFRLKIFSLEVLDNSFI